MREYDTCGIHVHRIRQADQQLLLGNLAADPERTAIGPQALLLGNRLPVRITPQMPKGVAGILAGVPPFEGLELPAWHTIVRAV